MEQHDAAKSIVAKYDDRQDEVNSGMRERNRHNAAAYSSARENRNTTRTKSSSTLELVADSRHPWTMGFGGQEMQLTALLKSASK